MITDLKNRFTYHPPKANQPKKYENIRGFALSFAELIDAMCPDSREKSLAITALEESVFWANASIARNDKEEGVCNCPSLNGEVQHVIGCIIGAQETGKLGRP